MDISIQPFHSDYLINIHRIWNDVIITGTQFPQDNVLNLEESHSLFSQTS